ncbi:MAG: hypothetical protein QF645_03825 [Planctomycetota bacterium]|nr:hypothetical protein [Planctomycetota bacterium]
MELLFLFSLLLGQDPELETIQQSIDKTAKGSYFYTVQGRFRRTGVFSPPHILTARIRQFQSASNRTVQLVKGPEGLWSPPDSRVGEKIEGLDPEISSIMLALEDAEIPHRQIENILPLLKKGREESLRTVEGISCRVLLFSFQKEKMQKEIEAQLEKGIARGVLQKPTLVRWGTLRGTVRFYIHAKEKYLVRVIDRRSVKVFYRTTGVEEVKKYTNEIDYRFSGQGGAKPNLPDKVLKKLGLR